MHFIKHKKWIGLIVYPFFLFLSLSSSAQNQKLQQLLQADLQPGTTPTSPASESDLKDIYYDNLHDVLFLIFHESDSAFNALEKLESERIDAIESYTPSTPWKGFLVAEIKLQWAFIKLKYKEEWSAFWSLKSANKLINQNIESHPTFALNNRTAGMLNILFGVTPDNYKWIFNMFGMKGTVADGIEKLKTSLDSNEIFGLEASIILGMVYSHLLENTKVSTTFIDNNRFRSSPLAAYFQGIILQKSHRAEEARAMWQASPSSIPFVHYLIADSHFQEAKYNLAIQNYLRFLNNFKGTTYQKDTYLKLALSHQFLGKQSQSDSYYNLAKNSIANSSEIDKNAQKILEELPATNLKLLKLRFAIDGGFFPLADELIQQLKSFQLSEAESVELTYRQARMAHIQGEKQKAMALYTQVTNKEAAIQETYYAPNSFLQMAYLQRDTGNKKAAQVHFEKVLSFKRHPYKSSLDSKAKVGLSLLNLEDE